MDKNHFGEDLPLKFSQLKKGKIDIFTFDVPVTDRNHSVTFSLTCLLRRSICEEQDWERQNDKKAMKKKIIRLWNGRHILEKTSP